MTHAFMDSSPARGTFRVVMGVLPLRNTKVKDDWIHQVVGRIHFSSHLAIKVVKEQAIGAGSQLPPGLQQTLANGRAVLLNILNIHRDGQGLI